MSILSQDEIREHIMAAARKLNAKKAWLFGSYARGDAREDSDVDVLFVTESTLPRPLRSEAAYDALDGLDAPKDVLVYTPEEFSRWKHVPGALCYNVIHEGIELV